MQGFSTILFQILDGLIKILLPVLAGIGINFLNKKLGREKFLLAKDVVSSIVSTIEQQYRSGEIPKDDRFALAVEQGIKRTGLNEEQVVNLIKDAVFAMNVQLRKYDYPTSTAQGFTTQGDSAQVFDGQSDEQTTPVTKIDAQPAVETSSTITEEPSLLDSLVLPEQT